jgi:hypothetical protein
MSVDQLFGKYKRLKKDLSVAYSQPQWNAALVDRLVDEIGVVERELAQRAPLGTSHPQPAPLPKAGEGGTTASPPAR